MKPLLWGLLCAVAAGSGPVLAVHNDGFELDGDAITNRGGQDWDSVYANFLNNANAPGESFFVDPVNASTDNIFIGGGSKDERDISSAGITKTFWQNTTGSPPDKDDLEHAFAVLKDVPNGAGGTDEVIFFGADRYSNSGDSAIGFWFFKTPVTAGNGTFTGKHTVGDVLVTSDFLVGGSTDVINVFIWNGNASNPLTKIASSDTTGGSVVDATTGLYCLTNDTACALANKIDGSASPWPYTFKGSAPANTFPHGTLFEGGINITQLLGGAECFSSFMAMTRTSASTTAQLKDFVVGPFRSCSIGITKACQTVGLSGDPAKPYVVQYQATLTNTGDSALPATTHFVVVDNSGTPNDTSDDLTSTADTGLAAGGTLNFNGQFNSATNGPTNTISATATFAGNTLSSSDTEVCTSLILNPQVTVTKDCGSSDGSKPGTELVLNPATNRLELRVNVHGTTCNTSTPSGLSLNVSVYDDAGGIDNPPDPTLVSSGLLATGGCRNYDYSYFPSRADGPSSPASLSVFSDQATAVGVSPINAAITAQAQSLPITQCRVCPN